MNLIQELSHFDLGPKEATLYLALLELGTATVIDLSKKTAIKRTTVYDLLLELEKKELLFQTKKGKKRLFIAQTPDKLQKSIEEKQNRLESLMPALKALVNTTGTKPVIRYHEGIEGIKEVYRDTLSHSGELLAFISENIFEKLGQDFSNEYKQKRKNADIVVRILAPETSEPETTKEDLRTFRYVNKDNFPFTMELNIYGNKVAIMSFKEEMGIVIESNEISKNLSYLFELAWIGASQ